LGQQFIHDRFALIPAVGSRANRSRKLLFVLYPWTLSLPDAGELVGNNDVGIVVSAKLEWESIALEQRRSDLDLDAQVLLRAIRACSSLNCL
jgi:hypothetical protein